MTTVALLGTGIMGRGMTTNLVQAGHDTTVWNRTAEKAEGLGARVAAAAADAVQGAEVVVLMLADGEATRAVVDEIADGFGEGAVLVQTATIGLAATAALAAQLDGRAVLVDAPVLGTRGPAEAGELIVFASGPADVRERVDPILDAIGKRTIWLGEAGEGSRLKVVVNTWLTGLTGVLAETLALAEGLGVAPATFLDAIDGGPVGPPYARLKGEMMAAGSYETSFPLQHARKDADLALAAGREAGGELSVTEVVARRYAQAVDEGYGDEDMAAVRRVVG